MDERRRSFAGGDAAEEQHFLLPTRRCPWARRVQIVDAAERLSGHRPVVLAEFECQEDAPGNQCGDRNEQQSDIDIGLGFGSFRASW